MLDIENLLAEIEAEKEYITPADLNPMQKKALDKFVERMLLGRYETKKFRMYRLYGRVTVSMITGSPNDDGNALSFYRRYPLFNIGPRGKIEAISEC